MKMNHQELLIRENKSKVLLLRYSKGYYRDYQLAIKIYLYFKGKINIIDSTLEEKVFRKALYREIPYA